MHSVLVVGSGGREHALGWKLAQSPYVSDVFYAPGNGGTLRGKGRNIAINGNDVYEWPELADFVKSEGIDMAVVGSEVPLARGIVDYFSERGIERVFGPSRLATMLESDKGFSYSLLDRLNIPCARSKICSSGVDAMASIKEMVNSEGVVLKTLGPAAGKGVVVCDNIDEAYRDLPRLISRYGEGVLVSERLSGPELSVFAVSDGEHVVALEMGFRDHKRLRDRDRGPNTGGMGAYGPVFLKNGLLRHVQSDILVPVVEDMAERGRPFRGFLYAGLMLTDDGPKVLEFNARFGDPECQAAMMMLQGDLYEIMDLTLRGEANRVNLDYKLGAACTVVLASRGYPAEYDVGFPIEGLDSVSEDQSLRVFHAGTKKVGDSIVTAGGRVLGVTAHSPIGLVEAQAKAYEAARKITIPNCFHYRRDIGGIRYG